MNMNNIADYIKEGCLITSGNIENYNTMTIGWGTIGVLWSKKVFIAYVKPIRYTYSFLNDNEYFTISFYKEDYKKQMLYLGTHSGKDEDKVGVVGFNPVELDKYNTVTFKEAYHTIVCKKIYYQDLDINQIPKDVIDKYYVSEEPHRFYVGEIIEEIKR